MATETKVSSSGADLEATGPHALARHVEHIPVTVYASSAQASRAVAREIAELIRAKAARGERAVLGLATGVAALISVVKQLRARVEALEKGTATP